MILCCFSFRARQMALNRARIGHVLVVAGTIAHRHRVRKRGVLAGAGIAAVSGFCANCHGMMCPP